MTIFFTGPNLMPLHMTKKWNLKKKEILFGIGRKYCGKRRKCWLPALSPFPTMFSKDFSVEVVKSREWVVKC